MKRFIVTKAQLNEYLERKRAEKTFYKIIESLYLNKKSLNENVSHQKANQSVIDNYRRKNLINPRVNEMLQRHHIINDKHEII